MPGPDLNYIDAIDLAEQIRGGDISQGEFLELALARIRAMDPLIGAVALRAEDSAGEQAARLDPAAPFAEMRAVA